MKSLFIFICMLFILTSCWKNRESFIEQNSWSNLQTESSQESSSMIPVDSGSTEHQEPLKNNTGTGTNEYTFFFDKTNEEIVTLHHTAGQATKIYFINSDAKKMKVVATPKGENGNIRLSQIIAPDGTADGPFGQETNYELTQNGGYQLIFNENMMAGDPWSGEVEIKVTLTK